MMINAKKPTECVLCWYSIIQNVKVHSCERSDAKAPIELVYALLYFLRNTQHMYVGSMQPETMMLLQRDFAAHFTMVGRPSSRSHRIHIFRRLPRQGPLQSNYTKSNSFEWLLIAQQHNFLCSFGSLTSSSWPVQCLSEIAETQDSLRLLSAVTPLQALLPHHLWSTFGSLKDSRPLSLTASVPLADLFLLLSSPFVSPSLHSTLPRSLLFHLLSSGLLLKALTASISWRNR